ncbi:MAG: tRNA threonylcarbamoyladenosine dehydratase [Candidatus Ozemobacteraceae bacterium]
MIVSHLFDRNIRLWGMSAAKKLSASHVMVLGLGGVGSFAVEGLARAGIGILTLVDFDDICITNVNRQLHALPSTIGKSKAQLMADRVRLINPGIQAEPIPAFYEASTSRAMLARKPDLIIDAIDNVTAKLHILATSIMREIPIVTCLGASGKVDPTLVRTNDLRKTKKDPLAKTIRKNLWRKYRINLQRVSDLIAVYSEEEPAAPQTAELPSLCGTTCVCPNSANEHHTCAKRSIIWGSSVFVTSMFGMTAASLAVRFLTGDPAIRLTPVTTNLPGDDPMIDPAQATSEENNEGNDENEAEILLDPA